MSDFLVSDFLVGFFVGCILMFFGSGAINVNAKYHSKMIEIGQSVCSSHGGLKSYDDFNNFECANGNEITLTSEQARKLKGLL